MHHLLLLRHATALTDGYKDRLRPLSGKGREEAKALGKRFADNVYPLPAKIFCSPALRTRETCELFLEASGLLGVYPSFVEEFYQGTVATLCDAISVLEEDWQTVLFIGHNPTWSEMIGYLSNEWAALAPANLAVLRAHSPEPWSKLTGAKTFGLAEMLN